MITRPTLQGSIARRGIAGHSHSAFEMRLGGGRSIDVMGPDDGTGRTYFKARRFYARTIIDKQQSGYKHQISYKHRIM